MKLAPVWLSLGLTLGACAQAAGLEGAEAIRSFSDQIMTQVADDDLAAAFELIEQHSVVEVKAVQAMSAKAVEQRKLLSQRIGAPIGFEWISTKSVGDSLMRLQYLEKTPKHALLWSFYFYKTADGWLLSTWTRDEQYEQLFLLG